MHDDGGRPPGTAPLPTLQAGGFSASVDAYAWEPAPDPHPRQMRLWFVSLLGRQEAVKALWARLIKGEVATLATETLGSARFCSLAPEGPGAWRFLTAGLPHAAAYQGVLLPECARFLADRPDFLLLPRAGDDPAALHYRFLNRRLDLPLHPSWAAWLWARALDCGEARPLEAHGLTAYRCVPDAAALAAALTPAVHRGVLRV